MTNINVKLIVLGITEINNVIANANCTHFQPILLLEGINKIFKGLSLMSIPQFWKLLS